MRIQDGKHFQHLPQMSCTTTKDHCYSVHSSPSVTRMWDGLATDGSDAFPSPSGLTEAHNTDLSGTHGIEEHNETLTL